MFRLVLLSLLFAPAAAYGLNCVGTPNVDPQTLPAEFTNFMVMTADASFTDPTFTQPAGSQFDVNVMGRNAGATAAQRSLAVTYFQTKFGVDFSASNVSPDGKWFLRHQTIDSRYQQKVVYAGTYNVPSDGWLVNQGYYRMEALDDQAVLYGTWGGGAGKRVIAGTFADFGEFRIAVRLPCSTSGTQDSFIDLNYQSIRPHFPDILSNGFGQSKGYDGDRVNLDYQLSYEPSATLTGTARGRVELKYVGGNYISQVRMVLKFS